MSDFLINVFLFEMHFKKNVKTFWKGLEAMLLSSIRAVIYGG